MRKVALTLAVVLLGAVSAAAQESQTSTDRNIGSSGSAMGELLRQGYEIKAAAPNGSRYVVFLQKDQSAYACEFVSLTRSQCGSIN